MFQSLKVFATAVHRQEWRRGTQKCVRYGRMGFPDFRSLVRGQGCGAGEFLQILG